MSWSFNLGTLFGIRIRVHWLFVVLLSWLLLFGGGLGAVALVSAVFACVLLHELGHCLTARTYGVAVRDITLLPIGGVARLEGEAPSPRAEFWIALAGPLVNVALALLFLPLALMAGAGQMALGLNMLGSLKLFLATLVSINLTLALFNLLPAFPMDGGRILRALLTRRLGFLEATRRAARVGRWMAALMAAAGVLLLHPILLFIALFVYVAGKQEEAAARWRRAHSRTLEFHPMYGWHYTDGQGPRVGSRPLDARNLKEAFQRLFHNFRRFR